MSSSIKYYHKRRKQLLLKIQERNNRTTEVVSCKDCNKQEYEEYEFHIDHINKENGHASGIGGYQHLYKCIEDFKEGIDLAVRCAKCHKEKDGVLFTPKVEEEIA